jgi:hypothetical protein
MYGPIQGPLENICWLSSAFLANVCRLCWEKQLLSAYCHCNSSSRTLNRDSSKEAGFTPAAAQKTTATILVATTTAAAARAAIASFVAAFATATAAIAGAGSVRTAAATLAAITAATAK